MSEKNKKKWEEFDIDGIKSGYILFKEILQNLNRFSTYMITIGMATLGFFISMLFQIKSKPTLPNKYFAIVGMLFLVFSVVFGFYIRLGFEARELLLKFQQGLREFSGTIAKATEYEMTSEEEQKHNKGMKAFSVIESYVIEAKNSVLSPRFHVYMIIQVIALLIGIILSAGYMFWYIFVI